MNEIYFMMFSTFNLVCTVALVCIYLKLDATYKRLNILVNSTQDQFEFCIERHGSIRERVLEIAIKQLKHEQDIARLMDKAKDLSPEILRNPHDFVWMNTDETRNEKPS